jgi:predicted secreted protein
LCALVVVSLWLAASVHALGSGSKVEEGGSVVILQKEDNGREVEVKPGDVIQVELNGSGGTGYWWYATKMDAKYAELVSEETKAPAEKKPGGPVKGIWRIKVKGQGKTDLIMKYYRVWEGSGQAVDQFSVILDIK